MNGRSRRGNDHKIALLHILRIGDDLDRLPAAHVYLADKKRIGVLMGLLFEDFADHKALQAFGFLLVCFNF